LRIAFLYLQYIRRLISYYIEGKTGNLADIVNLEEGFYHDLKGIFNKRLGLPINKYKLGNRNKSIVEDILSGASEIARRFREAQNELFSVLPPDRKLVQGLITIGRLKKAIEKGPVEDVILLLEEIRESSFSYYDKQIRSLGFELEVLLRQIASDVKPDHGVKLSFEVENHHHGLRLPYSDYNAWRRIFHNFIINAIEAVEAKGCAGRVDIKLSYPENDKASVSISDTGIGMDTETISNFGKRGFTKGKPGGQGLGVNEDTIAYIKRNGKFDATSSIGIGTVITVEINPALGSGSAVKVYFFPPQFRRKLTTSLAVLVLLFTIYLIIAMIFQPLRFGIPPTIVGFRLNQSNPQVQNIFNELIALGEKNNRLWTLTLESPYCISENSRPPIFGQPACKDMDNDGQKDLIFASTIVPHSDKDQIKQNSYVACYNGNEKLLWKTYLGPDPARGVFDIPFSIEGPYSSQFYGSNILDLEGKVIIPVIGCSDSYSTQVLLLDNHGSKVAEYWHAGFLFLLSPILDYDDDNKLEFVFYGMNNCVGRSPAISIMEVEDISGQSYPYLDSIWSKAREEKYYIFGHAWIDEPTLPVDQGSFYGGERSLSGTMFTGAEQSSYMSWDSNGPMPFNGIKLTTDDGRTVILNNHTEIDTVIIDTLLFSKWWYSREKQIGKTTQWTQADINQLRGFRKFIYGDLAADSIIDNSKKYNRINWDAH
jgi:hypothetical protein